MSAQVGPGFNVISLGNRNGFLGWLVAIERLKQLLALTAVRWDLMTICEHSTTVSENVNGANVLPDVRSAGHKPPPRKSGSALIQVAR
jgi:hypothetical protein